MNTLFFIAPVTAGDLFHFLFEMSVVECAVREVILEAGNGFIFVAIVVITQKDGQMFCWLFQFSWDDDLGILDEMVMCPKPLKQHARDLFFVIVIDVQVAVGLHIEVLLYGKRGVMHTTFHEALGPAHVRNEPVDLLSEDVCHEGHPLEPNDHAVTTLFALYEQYTT